MGQKQSVPVLSPRSPLLLRK